MEREFQCPSCGASNKVTNPGILMQICAYCKTALYWDTESALRMGNKSMDLPPSQRFKVGGSGKIAGSAFRVLGRISYAHDAGTWDEWFIEDERGSIKWLSEDEGELFLETPADPVMPVPVYQELRPGMKIRIGDKSGTIEEIGQAKCIGGEGEIPFQVEIGETYPYADGSLDDGRGSFGLEFDPETGKVQAFTGKILTPKDTKTRPEDRGPAQERLSQTIRCRSCGKPYEGPRNDTTRLVVCGSCGSAMELDEAQAKVVGKNTGKQPTFTFPVGTPLQLEGARYEVMGRLLYEESLEGKKYASADYALYNADLGYVWLSEEDGHYTLGRVVHDHVSVPAMLKAKDTVTVGSESFRFYERGLVKLAWVDGALPWTAKVGEISEYVHLIKPPECVDIETTGSELEVFRKRYLPHEELEKANPDVVLPSCKGVYSCEPYAPYWWLRGLTHLALVFLAVNVALAIVALMVEKPKWLIKETIPADRYTAEHLTAPFRVPHDRSILKVDASAGLNNSWIALDFALVDDQDRVITECDSEVAYYYGHDSEGSWTEGSPTATEYIKVDRAGTYRLLVYGQGGSGDSGQACNEPLEVSVSTDSLLPRYFLWPIGLSALLAAFLPWRRHSFESKRWAEVMPESDDGDDD